MALLKAGLSSTQILSICEANTRILKLEKHKYWITVTILMTKNPPPEILYDILIRNPSRIDLEREYKKMPKYKKIIP